MFCQKNASLKAQPRFFLSVKREKNTSANMAKAIETAAGIWQTKIVFLCILYCMHTESMLFCVWILYLVYSKTPSERIE